MHLECQKVGLKCRRIRPCCPPTPNKTPSHHIPPVPSQHHISEFNENSPDFAAVTLKTFCKPFSVALLVAFPNNKDEEAQRALEQ